MEIHVTTLMGCYLICKELFLSALWSFPTWRISLVFVMSEWHPVFPTLLPRPSSGWLPPCLKQTLSLLSFVSPCLLLITWSISSPLPSPSVDGCYAVFHYTRSPHFIQVSSQMMGLTETFLNSCSCHSAQGSERTATPQPSRNEEYHFPGLLCSVSHTHICISSQLLSTLPVLFACLALGVAPRTFCSPFLSTRRKVGHSTPMYYGMPTGRWPGWGEGADSSGHSQHAGSQGTSWHPWLQLKTVNNSQNPGCWTLLSLPTILESSQSGLNTNVKEIPQKPHTA